MDVVGINDNKVHLDTVLDCFVKPTKTNVGVNGISSMISLGIILCELKVELKFF